MTARTTTARDELLKGIWRDNPVFAQLLGLCPALAVTNSLVNGIAMSAATMFVLLGSSILISTMKRLIPGEVRISAYILIIATFVTLVDLVMAAVVPEIYKTMGAFIALIVVNCMILGRQEAFASRNGVGRSALDALGMGTGFTIALLAMSSVREVLGAGTLLGVPVMGPSFEPWVIMILPPGGFFTLGLYLLAFGWWKERRAPARRLRPWPHAVTALEPERQEVGA